MAEPSTAEAEALVYIVDDDASVRAAIEDLLASVGLCVRAFGATREFLDHWQRQPPRGLHAWCWTSACRAKAAWTSGARCWRWA